MICPTCKNEMIVVEYRQIELDYCNNCHGVWFDSGELELMLESSGIKQSFHEDLINSPEVSTTEAKRNCPICKHKLKKTNVGQPPILIDVCRLGDGLWFDGGEMMQLVNQLAVHQSHPKETEHQVLDFLGEVFQAPQK